MDEDKLSRHREFVKQHPLTPAERDVSQECVNMMVNRGLVGTVLMYAIGAVYLRRNPQYTKARPIVSRFFKYGSLPIAGYYASQTARSACIERFTELDTPYARHFRAFALNDQSVSDPMYEEINDGSSAVEDELKLWQERNGVVAYDHRKDIYLVKSENSAQALAEQEQLQQTQAQQQQQQQAQQNSSDKNFITFEDLRQRAMAEDARKRAAQQAAAEEKAAKIRARKQKSSDDDDEVDGAPTGGQKKGTTWSEIRKHVSEYGIESSPS